jgi:carboxypeptidase family protein
VVAAKSLLALFVGGAAGAQVGGLHGTVLRDTLGHGVRGAEVRIDPVDRTVQTNLIGEFSFSQLPAGRYAILVRAVGFEVFRDSIEVKPGIRLDVEVVLTQLAVQLSPQVTTAQSRATSEGLRGMEDRARTHVGGYFVTDSMLRARENERLTLFFGRIPGITQVLGTRTGSVFLSSGRGTTAHDRTDGSFPLGHCYITVYVDGFRLFLGPSTPFNAPPDVSGMMAQDYAGVEYYPGGAAIPAQFNATGSGCGTLLLWTRQSR